MGACKVEYYFKIVDEHGEYMMHTKMIMGVKDNQLPTLELVTGDEDVKSVIADIADCPIEQIITITSDEYEELESDDEDGCDDECDEDCINCKHFED